MPDLRKISRAHMASLVQGMGCYDAVAETINARWGGGASKGTISKKMSGVLDWTMLDVIAIEDALGRHPVTRMMARRLGERVVMADGCMVAQVGLIAKESGEAISAILAAEQSCCANERAQALVEVDEAIVELRKARARLEPSSSEPVGGEFTSARAGGDQ